MLNLDLNLLAILVALEEQRSVSRAAAKLGMSQPAVSAALGKLRIFFDDPLFLRAGNSMQPSPRALSIAESARSVLHKVNAEIITRPSFNPAASEQPVRLGLSDVGELVFLPDILRKMRTMMPRALVCSVTLPAADVVHELEGGGLDLAVGYFPDLAKTRCYQQTLFKDSFTCLIRADHPIRGEKLTMRQFTQLEHAVVRVESRTQEVIERYLERRKMHRQTVLMTPHFSIAPMIVAQSDLVVVVPIPLARYFATMSSSLRIIGLPFEAPSIELKQYWHPRFHQDPRNRWMRSTIFDLFSNRRSEATGS